MSIAQLRDFVVHLLTSRNNIIGHRNFSAASGRL
jgi:hypothetical protein